MASSLTQIAIITRKVVRYGIFFVIFLIVGRIVLTSAVALYKKMFPPPPPPPTVTYGKLPKIPFPDKTSPANLNFTLETAEGGYPTLLTQAKVFFMPKPTSNLLSLETARNKAKALKFDSEGQQVSPTLYKFSTEGIPSTLEMDIVTGSFSISYDLKSDPSPLDQRPPFPEIAASSIRSYLSSANILPADLTGPSTHEFLKPKEGNFVTALSQSEAKLIKINLFRKSYDNFPCLSQDTRTANVWFMISGIQDKNKQIMAGEFHYFPVDETQFSTYPLKTSEEVWKEFGEGKAFVAKDGNHKEGDNIKIRKIYLAYYDPDVAFGFLEPIIVFDEGIEDGFMAYIPAVTNEYYGEP